MKIANGWLGHRKLERVFLALGAVMLTLLFIKLFTIDRKDFADVNRRLKEGSMVNLNAGNTADAMRKLLQNQYYLEDPRDVNFATDAIRRGFSQPAPVDNIGDLNKSRFNVSATEAYIKGGESYKSRAKLSRYLIGFSDKDSTFYEKEERTPASFPASTAVGIGDGMIRGQIYTSDEKPAPHVLVRLAMVTSQDSLYNSDVEDELQLITETNGPVRKVYLLDSSNTRQLQTVIAYARSDGSGRYSFTGLPEGRTFEVLPLKPGYQFGSSRGIGDLQEQANFSFIEMPHTLKLFRTSDFNNLRKEKALIVRMPDEVINWYWIISISFLVSFFIVHLILSIKFPEADQLILPVLMLLIGLSFLTLLSLQDPLRDRFLARSSFYYFISGMGGICLMLLFDLRLFTPDSLLFRLFVFKESKRAANGWPWAIGAGLLLVLTILFGNGPEGSGVKVNLLGFQPSEVVKYLLIIFLAGFFTANEKFITEYTRWQRRWAFLWFALIAILGVIFLFLLLGDLGPAMVCCFSFIILFSFSRGDFIYAIAAVVLYVLAIWLFKNIWIATGVMMTLVIASAYFIRKGLSESAIMSLVVMAGFLLLDKIPYLAGLIPGPMQRLIDRKAIWQDPWNNEVFGGDHIANAIWGMTSGGISGQGIGEGFAKTIPEAHTDMILPSLGEEFGWAGILCVFILFLIYVHRAIIIGRQTGRPFLFYLCAGIGIATFVQFLLIAGGSIGALPLSGVSLPFMSYGGSSLIVNMIAAGFLLSASNVKGSPVQMKYISRQQDHNLVPALMAALVGIVLLSISISRYLFYSKKWVVQPALVADRSGARIFSYNPRIAILMNRLQAGSLYDRNGNILATSHPQLIEKQKAQLVAMGVDGRKIEGLMRKRLDRYYPLAENMFFWTGDMNTGIFMGGTNGYFGEYELMAELRGFETPETNYKVTATRYREERFLPVRTMEMTVRKRDFTALSPLLLAGINSGEVEAFKNRNRDVQLTVDANLQTSLNTALSNLDSLKSSRISVVVMDAANGDVLASAAYPMAPVDDPDVLLLTAAEQNKLPYWVTTSDIGFTHATQPGSTAKLVTALAAFNKLGLSAAQKVITVHPWDLIRTGGGEPDEAGNITIERGLVKSNNPFFIRLANEYHLQEEMATIYMQAGMFLHGVGGYYFEGDVRNAAQQEKWRALWRKTEFNVRYDKNNIRRTRGRGISGMAWGQGELVTSPAALARVACGIANNGTMIQNRYVLKVYDSLLPVKPGIAIANDPAYAALMRKYMKEQSAPKAARLGMVVAGKTGTPERIVRGQRINDGWYVFFAPKIKGPGYIVTCIRIEKCRGSGVAVALAGAQVIPVLKQLGYIRSFEQEQVNNNTAETTIQ